MRVGPTALSIVSSTTHCVSTAEQLLVPMESCTDVSGLTYLIERLPDALALHEIICDDQGAPIDYRFLRVNAAFEAMTGLRREDILGRRVTEVLPSITEGGFDWIGTFGQVALTGEELHFEQFSQPLQRWYEVDAFSDQPGHFGARFRDCTERKRIDADLRQSNDDLRRAQFVAKVGNWRYDFADGGQLIWSEQTYRIFAVEPGTPVTYQTLLSKVHPKDRVALDEAWRNSVNTGVPYIFTHRILVENRIKWVEERAELSADHQGQWISAFGTVQDVTDRILARKALESERQRLRNVIDATQVGTFEWNLESREARVDQRWAQLLGYQLDAIHPVSLDWIVARIDPDQRSRFEQQLRDHARGRTPEVRLELRLRHRSDQWVWLLIHGRLNRSFDDGGGAWMSGTFTDVSEHKEMEAEVHSHLERYQAIVDTMPVTVCRWLPDTTLTFANKAYLEQVAGSDTVIGQSWLSLLPESVRAETREVVAELEASPRVLTYAHAINHPSGGQRHYHWVDVPLFDANGTLREFQSVGLDITEQRANQARLELAARIFTAAREGIVVTSMAGKVLEVNDAFLALTGYRRSQLLGSNIDLLRSPRHRLDFYQAIWSSLQDRGFWHGEICSVKADGQEFPAFVSISEVQDGSQEPAAQQYVLMFTDLTQQKQQEEKLVFLSLHDKLTGLLHREAFTAQLQAAMQAAQEQANTIALVNIDLDNFGAFNLQYGDAAGDAVLVSLVSRLQQQLRPGDVLGRLGGDELAWAMVGLPHEHAQASDQALTLSETLLEKLRATIALPDSVGPSVELTASMGLALYPQVETVDAEQLLRHADQALYRAKIQGKNQVHVFDPRSDRKTRKRMGQLNEIRDALQRDEFVLFYQPKVDLRSGAVLGFEALIRWQHPQRGLLPPGEFIPIIEDDPLIIEVGQWCLGTALDQLQSWGSVGIHTTVSVNIATLQLHDPDFVADVKKALKLRPRVQPAQLELEILETGAMPNIAFASNQLAALRALGVTAALDDFGTGFSSLTFLKRLPTTSVKIDQSFVLHLLEDPEATAIVSSVLSLARSLDRQVVAEGVENEALGCALLELGCDIGQGYAIARPMPADAVSQWLTHWQAPLAWTSRAGTGLKKRANGARIPKV